jgi:hypothetical protein
MKLVLKRNIYSILVYHLDPTTIWLFHVTLSLKEISIFPNKNIRDLGD